MSESDKSQTEIVLDEAAREKVRASRFVSLIVNVFGITFIAVSISVPASYAEYNSIGKTIGTFMMGIPFLLIGGFLAHIGIKGMFMAPEKILKSIEMREAKRAGAVAVGLPTYEEQYCEYCGTKIPFGSIKCPNCGAYVEKKN